MPSGEKRRQKSPAVVGSGDASRAQAVQQDLVLAEEFQVLQVQVPPHSGR